MANGNWSASRISTFNSCPLKYYYTYVKKWVSSIPADNTAANKGLAFHETVEKYTPASDDNKGSSLGSSGNEKGSGSTSGSSSGSGSGSGSSNVTKGSNDGNEGTSSNSNGNSNTDGSSTSAISNNQGHVIANYGTNSSDVVSESTSQTGDEQQSQGQENAAELGSIDSGESSAPGDSEKAGKVYELGSVSKKTNPLQDNSIIIVLAIVFLVVIFIYGYKRKNEFE